jgi:hypothetical protein
MTISSALKPVATSVPIAWAIVAMIAWPSG